MMKSLAGYLILFIAIIYIVIGICLWIYDGKIGLSIAYISYAIANVGLYIETLK